MSNYIKVMFGNKGIDYEYKIDEINIADTWNPKSKNGKDFGGFNYTTESNIIRWLHRGDTIYDVIVPKDAEIIKLKGATTIYRCNKIILTNPRKITDEVALEYYKKSKIPKKSYYKALAAVSVMGYRETALAILKDRINLKTIDEAIEEWNDFIDHNGKDDRKNVNELVKEIEELLYEIKSTIDISLYVEKEPYIKELTDDNIINLTGQSGSGKSYYANKHFKAKKYEIVDTDEVLSEKRFEKSTGLNKEIGKYLREKYKQLPNLSDDFDLIYKEIINYCSNIDKTIVIDCAQFNCIKDISLLKGKLIVIRTDIETCYNRAISRWIQTNKKNKWKYTEQDLNDYKNKKKKIYLWYKGTNEFIRKIDNLSTSKTNTK